MKSGGKNGRRNRSSQARAEPARGVPATVPEVEEDVALLERRGDANEGVDIEGNRLAMRPDRDGDTRVPGANQTPQLISARARAEHQVADARSHTQDHLHDVADIHGRRRRAVDHQADRTAGRQARDRVRRQRLASHDAQ
jgi:hypothetical protein